MRVLRRGNWRLEVRLSPHDIWAGLRLERRKPLVRRGIVAILQRDEFVVTLQLVQCLALVLRRDLGCASLRKLLTEEESDDLSEM